MSQHDDEITIVNNDDAAAEARTQICNLEEEMNGFYGTRLRSNLRTRKRKNIIPEKNTNNSCANYRDKESRTNANVAAQLHALSPMQDLKEYARIYATLHCQMGFKNDENPMTSDLVTTVLTQYHMSTKVL